jgi:hypothetical protein
MYIRNIIEMQKSSEQTNQYDCHKIVIFEFDCTLTKFNVSFFLKNNDQLQAGQRERIQKLISNEKLDNILRKYNTNTQLTDEEGKTLVNIVFDNDRINFLKCVFDKFKSDGYLLAVASDNWYPCIDKFLTHAGLRYYFDIIKDSTNVYSAITKFQLAFSNAYNQYNDKSKFIIKLFETDVMKIIYFDDDAKYFNKLKTTYFDSYIKEYFRESQKYYQQCTKDKNILIYYQLSHNGDGLQKNDLPDDILQQYLDISKYANFGYP